MKNPNCFIGFLLIILILSRCSSRSSLTTTTTITKRSSTAESTSNPLNNTIVTKKTQVMITPAVTLTIKQKPTQTPTMTPRQRSIQEMLVVVDAVELYFNNNGVYPASINDLIPYYLEELPFTNEGHEIWYKKDEQAIYGVGFDPGPNNYCGYLKIYETWECGFYSEH